MSTTGAGGVRARRPWRRLAIFCVAAIALEIALAHALAGRDVVGRLLAGGLGASAGLIMLALGYVFVRLVVFVVLPGVVAARAAAALVERVRRRRSV
jgi:hypothetical protein